VRYLLTRAAPALDQTTLSSSFYGHRVPLGDDSSFKSRGVFDAVACVMGLLLRHVSRKDLRQLATRATTIQIDHFRAPQGWRTPYCLTTLSGLDLRFRRAILATIACLLLPSSFAELITPTSDFSRQRVCALLLDCLAKKTLRAYGSCPSLAPYFSASAWETLLER
jgi:hypothetical protein